MDESLVLDQSVSVLKVLNDFLVSFLDLFAIKVGNSGQEVTAVIDADTRIVRVDNVVLS